MAKQLLLVFLGGGAGSALRYLFSKWMNQGTDSFPWHTFSVNVLGSFIIGLVIGWAMKEQATSSPIVLLIAIGFCGGFTTFSSFALENLNFLKSGDYWNFSLYALGSLVLGILVVFLGMWLVKLL